MEHKEEAKEYEVENPWETDDNISDEDRELLNSFLSDEDEKREEAIKAGEQPEKNEGAEGTPQEKPEEEKSEEDAGKTEEERAEEPMIEVGGEKVPISQIEEWRKGYLRQQDYTKKTQAIAEERRQLQEMRALFEQFFGNQPAGQMPIEQSTPTEEMEFATDTEKRLYQELQQIKQQVGGLVQHQVSQAQQSAINYVENCIKEFKSKYPSMSEEELTQVLEKTNNLGLMPSVESFETVYKSMLDIDKIKEQAIKEYIEKELPKKQKAKLEPSKESDKTIEEDLDELNDNELFERMVREFQSGG